MQIGRLGVAVSVLVVSCARPEPPPPPAAEASSDVAAEEPATAAAASVAPPEWKPWPNSCADRGLPQLNPCPGGSDVDVGGSLSEPETLVFCCESGPVGPYETGTGCLGALQAARACKDAAGEKAALARLAEAVKVFGHEPCKDPVVRKRFQRTCASRGFP